MSHDIDINGIFVPDLGLRMLLAFAAATAVSRILAAIGIERFVWHRPLFNTAVYVIVLGLVVSVR